MSSKDNLSPNMLDQLIERANLRLAWRSRFSDFLPVEMSALQQAHLQAECLRVFGPGWGEEFAKDEAWHGNRA
jgi:hypothetical protein